MVDYLGFLVEKALVGAKSQDEVQAILKAQDDILEEMAAEPDQPEHKLRCKNHPNRDATHLAYGRTLLCQECYREAVSDLAQRARNDT